MDADLTPYAHRAGYPGAGGGLWLRMIFPPGLVTWLVPSGKTISCQPIWCSTTWWCHQHYADLWIMPMPVVPVLGGGVVGVACVSA